MESSTGDDRGATHSEGPGPGGQGARTYAAIDLGTNNCRMLIARPADLPSPTFLRPPKRASRRRERSLGFAQAGAAIA